MGRTMAPVPYRISRMRIGTRIYKILNFDLGVDATVPAVSDIFHLAAMRMNWVVLYTRLYVLD